MVCSSVNRLRFMRLRHSLKGEKFLVAMVQFTGKWFQALGPHRTPKFDGWSDGGRESFLCAYAHLTKLNITQLLFKRASKNYSLSDLQSTHIYRIFISSCADLNRSTAVRSAHHHSRTMCVVLQLNTADRSIKGQRFSTWMKNRVRNDCA